MMGFMDGVRVGWRRAPFGGLLGVLALGVPGVVSGQDTVADTVTQAEVVPLRNPMLAVPVTSGLAVAEPWVREWDRSALLNAIDVTLPELLARVPGLVIVRGGDYGAPVGITTGSLGAGQVRVFRDGLEEIPQEGGVVDLSQVGLGGLESVRVEWGGSEIRILLSSLRVVDPRPLTILDVATGDLKTNSFRIGFLHPSALGGTLLVGLDRIDTEGPLRRDGGSRYNTVLRYALFPREGTSLLVESRSRGGRHQGGAGQPQAVEGGDWTVRGGWSPIEGLTADLSFTRARVEAGATAQAGADTLLPSASREQARLGVSWSLGDVSLSAAGSLHGGDGWAANQGEVQAVVARPSLGGLLVHLDRQGWSVREPNEAQGTAGIRPGVGAGSGIRVRMWSPEVFGVSLFGEVSQSLRGRPIPLHDMPSQSSSEAAGGDAQAVASPLGVTAIPFHKREDLRIGGRVSVLGSSWSGVWFRTEADSLAPFGLSFDRRAESRPGGVISGVTVTGRVPMDRVVSGGALEGSLSMIPNAPSGNAAWNYLPEQSWAGAFTWYREGYDGKLEVWGDLGIRVRDPMTTPPGALASSPAGSPGIAPEFRSAYGRVQVRVMTVRVFVLWENFTFREGNADLPGRFLPQTRAVYGLRWTMWN